MKRLLVSTLISVSLVAPSLMAESNEIENTNEVVTSGAEEKSGLYLGLDYFTGTTNMETTVTGGRIYARDEDLDVDGFRLKLGTESEDGWRVQGYFKSENIENSDDNIYGIGVDVIKGFAVTPKFSPFIQAGVGYDWTALEDDGSVVYETDYLAALNFKLGVGAMYKITDTLEILGGFDWQYRNWQDIELTNYSSSSTIDFGDTSTNVYVGLNLHI